jgi:hypothetical protein
VYPVVYRITNQQEFIYSENAAGVAAEVEKWIVHLAPGIKEKGV